MLKLANAYGNFDGTHNTVPRGYALVRGSRLTVLCSKHHIAHVPAVTGWKRSRYGNRPIVGGVIVTKRREPDLLRLIAEREARVSDPKVIAARDKAKARRLAFRERQRTEHAARCNDLGIYDPDGKLATKLRKGYVTEDMAELIGFKARYRHDFTDYDMRFGQEEFRSLRSAGYSPQDAAFEMRETALATKIDDPIPDTWEEYRLRYGFTSPIAVALAATLRNPVECHPTWFKEAEIAVRRAELPLDLLTYETIKDAIEAWRDARHDAW